MNKLLDDAKAAGFDIRNEQVCSDTFHINITEKLVKFAALQIPEGYHLVQNEDSKNENLEIPTLDKMREIFARYPNKNMQTVTFDAGLYKLMPLKLTHKMRWLASLEMPLHHGRLDKMYKAMIAASPTINT